MLNVSVETKLSENQTQQSPILIDIELRKVLDIAVNSLQGFVFDYNSTQNYLRWLGIKMSRYNKINYSELYVSSCCVSQVGSIFSRDHICC
jgi:cytochrome c oxidase subunit IV